MGGHDDISRLARDFSITREDCVSSSCDETINLDSKIDLRYTSCPHDKIRIMSITLTTSPSLIVTDSPSSGLK